MEHNKDFNRESEAARLETVKTIGGLVLGVGGIFLKEGLRLFRAWIAVLIWGIIGLYPLAFFQMYGLFVLYGCLMFKGRVIKGEEIDIKESWVNVLVLTFWFYPLGLLLTWALSLAV